VDYLPILGERVRSYRKANNITQIELAEKLGVAPRYIGNVEQGNRKPSLDMLINICDYFGVGLSDLLPMEVEAELCPKDKLIYEITATCRTLEINQIGVVKSMVCAFNNCII